MAGAAKGAIAGTPILRITGQGIDSTSFRVSGSVSIKRGVTSREPIDGVGYTENESNSYIEAEIYDSCDLDLEALDNICGGEDNFVTVRLKNGKSYTLREAWLANEAVTNDEGKIAVRFESLFPAEQVLGC